MWIDFLKSCAVAGYSAGGMFCAVGHRGFAALSLAFGLLCALLLWSEAKYVGGKGVL